MKTDKTTFLIQCLNESDGDHCRYVVVGLDPALAGSRRATLDALWSMDDTVESIVFSGGFSARFLSADFPTDYRTEKGCPFSDEEQSRFDDSGFTVLSAESVEAIDALLVGDPELLDEVEGHSVFVTKAGLEFSGDWSARDGGAFVRSWTLPWEQIRGAGIEDVADDEIPAVISSPPDRGSAAAPRTC